MNFTSVDRERPLGRALRLYLVPSGLTGAVRSPFDRRIHFVGVVVPDRRGRGVRTFTVPPVATGEYTMARWCVRCSFGRTFVVGATGGGLPEADKTLLRIAMRSAPETCPVTVPNGDRPPGAGSRVGFHGNGLLWVRLPPSGTYPPGWHKILWFAGRVDGDLVVRLTRLDASAPTLVLDVNSRPARLVPGPRVVGKQDSAAGGVLADRGARPGRRAVRRRPSPHDVARLHCARCGRTGRSSS